MGPDGIVWRAFSVWQDGNVASLSGASRSPSARLVCWVAPWSRRASLLLLAAPVPSRLQTCWQRARRADPAGRQRRVKSEPTPHTAPRSNSLASQLIAALPLTGLQHPACTIFTLVCQCSRIAKVHHQKRGVARRGGRCRAQRVYTPGLHTGSNVRGWTGWSKSRVQGLVPGQGSQHTGLLKLTQLTPLPSALDLRQV